MKVSFVGAGPGDPELITVKGRSRIESADIIIYAGSLVNPELLRYAAPEIPVYNSAEMNLEEVTEIYRENKEKPGSIVRLHTGDPSLYGAIQEQIDFCRAEGIPTEVVPGVSSFFAAASSLQQEYTLPGISQTLILTRIAGRTPVPETENLADLARHGSSMAVFLSAGKMKEVTKKLLSGFSPDTPAAVVYRASWPDERIITGTLSDIAEKTDAAGIRKQALILVGKVLRAATETGFYEKSKLYDPGFSHEYRTGTGDSRSEKE